MSNLQPAADDVLSVKEKLAATPRIGPITNDLETVASLDDLTCLRVTGLVGFETCPRRWEAEVTGRGQAVSRKVDYGRIGAAVHQVLERFLKGEWSNVDEEWKGQAAFLTEATVNRTERQNVRDFCNLLADRLPRIIATEHRFVSPVVDGRLPLRATLDAIFWHEDDQCWEICDWKTNREFEPAAVWQAKLQPVVQTLLLRRWLKTQGITVCTIRYTIGYVNLGQFVSWMTDPHEDDAGALLRVLQLWDEFAVYRRRNEWPARLNPYCGNCPVRDQCPAAKAATEDLAALVGEMEAQGVSLLQRHETLSHAAKLAEGMLGEVRDQIRDRMTTAGEEAWEDNGLTASLRARQTRSADALAVLDILTERQEVSNAELREVLSVKLTALDKIVARHPEIAPALVGLIKAEEAETPTLTVRKMKSQPSQGVDT